ncbi:MAG: hypothetical protein A2Y76_10300 [Planctomycetes bacterium RBG_13_60_9]|nr:MAG: hypothetical protein A2Y76_10300 [Planctomycetes bacterium RBG_13_60_9]
MAKRASMRRFSSPGGFTLLELIVCTVILLIMTLAASPAIVGAHRSWQNTHDGVVSALIRDGREARIVFQRAVRRASLQGLDIGPEGNWIELPYYDGPESTMLDRYARLSWSDGCLHLEAGPIDAQGTKHALSDTVVCGHVSHCRFRQSGTSVQMKLTFTNGTTQMTTAAAAVINNK